MQPIEKNIVDPIAHTNERVVLCMKWGTKYGPEYVNRLYAMVRRHLHGSFRFVCLTDQNDGIRAEVQCLPIPDLKLPDGIPERGWKKLTTFEANLHGLHGTALFLDLDIVIVDDIDCFFEHPGEFVIIHDWKRRWRMCWRSPACGTRSRAKFSTRLYVGVAKNEMPDLCRYGAGDDRKTGRGN